MADHTAPLLPATTTGIVPPPRRRSVTPALEIHAVQLVTMLSLFPLAVSIVGFAALSHRRLAAPPRRRGRRRTYSDASTLLIALLSRLWHLSTREVCLWLHRWPALASACGLPDGRVIHPAHLSRRVRQLGPYPCWLLYLALVWQALRCGLLRGHDVVLDSTLLPAWSKRDPAAAWSYPTPRKGRLFGYKVHVLLDRAARLPLFFLLSPANRNDLPFAYPLLCGARLIFGLSFRVVRADGGYWGQALYQWIRTTLAALPIIPFNRKRQPLDTVRHLVPWPLSYAARAVIERFFAVAKRYYQLNTAGAVGWDAVLLRVTLTFCATLVVALAAHHAGVPALRLSPTRVLAHYLPVEETL